MSPTPALALAVIISGRGSNMAAIAHACSGGTIAARIVRVIADRRDAGGIALAQRLGLEVNVVPHADFPDRETFESALRAAIDASGAQLVVLAGFLRILSPPFVKHYAGAMLNIHPALLPKFTGLNTHKRALQAREAVHGASVHFVTGELDAGPVVLQARVSVRPEDSPESLSARVQRQEHIIYPKVIGWIAAKRRDWNRDVVYFDDRPPHAAVDRRAGRNRAANRYAVPPLSCMVAAGAAAAPVTPLRPFEASTRSFGTGLRPACRHSRCATSPTRMDLTCRAISPTGWPVCMSKASWTLSSRMTFGPEGVRLLDLRRHRSGKRRIEG